ncbi:transcriptional regulator with XRE-family HTH domain [Parabacteroides sp. PFB2-10]|uniref:helix-turn-helix domain-containing protein n=1 Tax=Parabacteroides sp. PFB2-10 TaxID=1742405 RepID=UPI0024733252|nr:helix-turn-helix transcriptional regulator [Parabacteroides sp. PFB2-10]MDH6311790.1 transcriptional regulator with XRE-family HTH domain [Parabacteroides sp. PFB2-10]MDL2245325.1 helix-turn-helix domain-containing protein [Parabacteroides sp. OttesenSCG-928-J18]
MNDISYNLREISDDAIARRVGVFIKHHRIEQNKTQEILAKEAAISRSTLSLLEKGETVTLTTLIQVLRVLDQLDVFNSFTIISQPSPIMLAKAEKKKRQRVASPRKKDTDIIEGMDW